MFSRLPGRSYDSFSQEGGSGGLALGTVNDLSLTLSTAKYLPDSTWFQREFFLQTKVECFHDTLCIWELSKRTAGEKDPLRKKGDRGRPLLLSYLRMPSLAIKAR